jgi:uncharacterized protein (DUF4415 family)
MIAVARASHIEQISAIISRAWWVPCFGRKGQRTMASQNCAQSAEGQPRTPSERKEQIALRLDADVLAWYRAQGSRWQTRMNAVLKAFRDASI